MNPDAPLPSTRKQHSVTLSDEAWAATLERAVLEETTASEICERLLVHYLNLESKPAPYTLPDHILTHKRSVHITKQTWAAATVCKVSEKRSISAILEQLLRAYTGLW